MRDTINLVEFIILRVFGMLITKFEPNLSLSILGLSMSIFSIWLLKQGSPVERKGMLILSLFGFILRII